MTAERIHHPACSANWGGLCTRCPSVTKQPVGYAPDITCDECGTTYIATGETPEKRAAAIAAWDGCCTPTDTRGQEGRGTDLTAGHNSGTRGAAGTSPASERTRVPVLGRLLSGTPVWVLRRKGVAW